MLSFVYWQDKLKLFVGDLQKNTQRVLLDLLSTMRRRTKAYKERLEKHLRRAMPERFGQNHFSGHGKGVDQQVVTTGDQKYLPHQLPPTDLLLHVSPPSPSPSCICSLSHLSLLYTTTTASIAPLNNT